MHVRKGDTVYVLTGRDRGKRGEIILSIPKRDRVVVEKLNLMKRHQKPSEEYSTGGIVTMEAPMHVSNVMLVCKSCDRPTRVGRKFLDDGTKVRYCKRCGATLD
ncbi:MAG: 50S ribosomal protein L24 [Firmicutes bacterium]|jgi:large subunit ribosomal protein L24|nr:50S ribosomal protein L24 [Bacillota bacterium]